MNVGQLISRLQKFPPDTTVLRYFDEWGYYKPVPRLFALDVIELYDGDAFDNANTDRARKGRPFRAVIIGQGLEPEEAIQEGVAE